MKFYNKLKRILKIRSSLLSSEKFPTVNENIAPKRSTKPPLFTIEGDVPRLIAYSNTYPNVSIESESWRQMEFVSNELVSLVSKELDAIKRNKMSLSNEEESVSTICERKLIKQPILLTFSVELMKKYFTGIEIGSLSFNGKGNVQNGIGFIVNTFKFYGYQKDKKIEVIGLISAPNAKVDASFIQEFKYFMKNEKLMLVNWCEGIIYNEDNIDQYLS